MDQASNVPSFHTAPPAMPGGNQAVSPGAGAISGGLLRPGAIDQPQFQAMLQAAQAAGHPGISPQVQPNRTPNQASIINGIPTLTPAQFAVLTGVQAAPNPEMPGEIPVAGPDTTPPTLVSGRTAPAVPPSDMPAPATQTPATQASDAGATKASETEKTPTADPRVVHFKHMPDKDERLALAASGKRWVVDETPGSRKLFFGDDEVFGWDDFVDLINPLQHIPIVAQIYRAVSGDQINGAAEILGSIPFGPSGFISGVADVAVRDVTGKDIGNNLAAMLFGSDAAPADTALAADDVGTAAPAGTTQTSAVETSAAPPPGRNIDRDRHGRDA